MAYAPPTRPDTPQRAPSYLFFVPRRSATLRASFDNLVALAEAQERLRGAAKKAVWRDRGEPVKELRTLEECLRHAGTGAFRAGALAYSIRAGVNLFLLLFRIRRVPRSQRFALIRHALLGPDPLRFGAMLGTFVYLYKLLLNALPILVPSTSPLALPDTNEDSPSNSSDEAPRSSSRPRHRHKLSLSASAQNAPIRKRARRWHAALAGAIAGGVAVLFEREDRRAGIGQQLLVRGLQGSWNSLSQRKGWRIPYGAVWLFAACTGQIMYATLMRPDTMPRAYVHWIMKASHLPHAGFDVNRSMIRDGTFDPKLVEHLANLPNTSPNNRRLLNEMLIGGMSSLFDNGDRVSPCHAVHNWRDSCYLTGPERVWQVAVFMAPVYGALNFIPTILFRQKAFLKEPLKVILRALMGTARSAFFLGVFTGLYQWLFCGKTNLWLILAALRKRAAKVGATGTKGAAPLVAQAAAIVPQSVQNMLVQKQSYWVVGFISGLTVLLEEPRRRAELALYVLPKALESAWGVARGRGYVSQMGWAGDALLAGVGCGALMGTYQNDPGHLGGLVRKVVYQFVGPN